MIISVVAAMKGEREAQIKRDRNDTTVETYLWKSVKSRQSWCGTQSGV